MTTDAEGNIINTENEVNPDKVRERIKEIVTEEGYKKLAELKMSPKDYRNYGWERDNDVISAGHWANFTTNFANALNNKNFDKITQDEEYMIEIYVRIYMKKIK